MKLAEGSVLDGFVIVPRVHSGAMAEIYRVTFDGGHAEPFPMMMKVPRMGGSEGAENLVGFEEEHQMLQALEGVHVPRLVAAGDIGRIPYLVMEYVEGRTLQQILEEFATTGRHPAAAEIAAWGRAIATAAHSLHRQNAVHLDLKPANAIFRPDGTCVLLDFGLSWHAHYPDLLAADMRPAVGSPAWMAPEQVVGMRGDPRSDVFAIGVMLYELATGELPFGAPSSSRGLRQRLWMDPTPPRAHNPDVPPWLQEIILHCLEPAAANRPPSAAHLAFDLGHPAQVQVGLRGQRTVRTPLCTQLRRWVRAAGMHYQPSPLPVERISEVPIVMVAVPHRDTTDEGLYALREATKRSLGVRPGARLACVTVVDPDPQMDEGLLHRHHSEQLRQWARGIPLDDHQVSYHVMQSHDVAGALLAYAESNHVSLIVLGAATHGLALRRWIPTIPQRVATEAPCSVLLVKDAPPFALLGQAAEASLG